MAEGGNLVSVDFEIYGVFFRRDTQKQAKKLHLVGWVMNTHRNTVLGQLQGPADAVKLMRHWLSKEGSPKSRIDKAEFRDERPITKTTYKNFSVKH
ncbi:acylphosphatase-1-like isoform X2 [Mercenaria mercenaria]|uniref:acylphosphatase-1-like isoform X2 n=1 Tax=Mercenaria mercenaria TaxID=6596 RepID=UPI00234F957D|nr:acylphosphatase-1-like isoform X2 [Mercenaria mercenaria]